MDPGEAELWLRALRLDPDAFATIAAVAGEPRHDALLTLVVVLAGLSEAVGHSAILFLNRVRAARFGVALVSSSLLYVLNYALWLASLWLLLRVALPGPDPALGDLARLLALAYAPRLLGFLVFTPLWGPTLHVATSIWSLLALLVGLEAVYGYAPHEAALATGGGWLLTQLSRHTVGAPLVALARALTRRAAGSDLSLDSDALALEMSSGGVASDAEPVAAGRRIS